MKKKLSKLSALLMVLVLCAVFNAFAQLPTVYVDATNGNDTYSGANPTNSPLGTGPKQTINAGLAAVSNTGTLVIFGGLYNGGNGAGGAVNITSHTGLTIRSQVLLGNRNVNVTGISFTYNTNGGTLRIINSGGGELLTIGSGRLILGGGANSSNIRIDSVSSMALPSGAGVTLNNMSAFSNLAPTIATNVFIVYQGSGTRTAGPEGNYGDYGTGGFDVNFTSGGVTFPSNATVGFFNLEAGTVTFNGNLVVNTQLAVYEGLFAFTGTLTMGNGAQITRFDGILSGGVPTFGTSLNIIYGGAGSYSPGSELPVSPSVLNNLSIIKSAGTVTLNRDIQVGGDLIITAGSLSTSASNYAVTLNGSFTNNGTFIANGSNITIGGTSATPTIAGFSTTGALFFTRTASTATLTGPVTAASLTMSGAGGTLDLGSGLSHQINGPVTITSGTLNGGSSTLGLAGDFDASPGTFTPWIGTVNFNGSADQAISGSRRDFYNLTLTKPAGNVIMGAADSVSGMLNLGANKIITGPYTLALASPGNVTRTTGYVVGSMQKSVLAGTNVSRTFEIGDASNFTPVDLTFTNVADVGNLVVNTTGSAHPDIANSGIDGTKDLHRYWTLTNRGVVLGGTYNATFNFQPGDVSGGAVPGNFIVAKNSAGTWSRPTVGTKLGTSTEANGLLDFSDFALGVPQTYTISGNAGVGGATLSYDDGGIKTATADGGGVYSLTVSYNWNGDVTPSKVGYTFTPTSKHYTNVLSNLAGENYSAVNFISVTNTNDAGPGSLRQAIVDANSTPGLNEIRFNIPGSGAHTIQPLSPLDAITDPVTIDGTTQPGFSGTPIIELDGSSAPAGANGLNIAASGCTVRGMVINRFHGMGINISSGSGNLIAGNYIGTDITGSIARRNDGQGIFISGGSNNIVGGISGSDRNVVSGNLRGVTLIDNTSNNLVVGNYIGTDVTGTVAIPNTFDGISVEGANTNRIGGTAAGEGNLISGNASTGIWIFSPGPSNISNNNLIQANLIGTNAAGTDAVPNGGGIVISKSPNNIVGGSTANARNIISGNLGTGVNLDSASTLNLVQGNYVGTTQSGSGALANRAQGISIRHAASNTIAGNVISGNNNYGVNVSGSLATSNVVRSNFIGTDPTGTIALGVTIWGVGIGSGASGNLIGGTGSGDRNIISGNGSDGVLITDNGTTGNLVQGNYIGLDISGTKALPNPAVGLRILFGASGNTIGGTTAAARNVISGNLSAGLLIYGSGSTNNLVQGNYIGTDYSGTKGLGNGKTGVFVTAGASGNTIGGATSGAGNVISGNLTKGVNIDGSSGGATNNLVQGNFIGTDVTGTIAIGNVKEGVKIDLGGQNNIIGGSGAGEGNLISGNGTDGVLVTGPASNGNLIQGNRIGTDKDGLVALGNTLCGVRLDSAVSNTIGGVTSGARNIISGNGQQGVLILSIPPSGTGNLVQGNYVGTDITGTIGIPNNPGQSAASNIGLSGAAHNTIVGNVSCASGLSGIALVGPGTQFNTIQGNYVGLNATGTGAIGNLNGIFLNQGASENLVGGIAPAERNIVSGNFRWGVRLDSLTHNNRILGNYIGTDKNGSAPIGNGDGSSLSLGGILVHQSYANSIGDTTSGSGNVICANVGNGITIREAGATGNKVLGNRIGVDVNGNAMGNSQNGVRLTRYLGDPNLAFPSDTKIGGTSNRAANTIAGNGAAGVRIDRGLGNSILSNSIYSNSGLGIDLGGDGVTSNDLADVDAGANNLQNYPVITSAAYANDKLTVAGILNSIASTTFTIQLYANDVSDPSGYGQGRTLLHSFTATTDAGGNASFNEVITSPVSVDPLITATATDASNNTSEFSKAVATGTQAPAGYVADTYAAGIKKPAGLAFDSQRRLLVAESGSGTIYRYDNATTRTVVADHFVQPIDIVVVGNDLYVSDVDRGGIYRIDLSGTLPVDASLLTPLVASLDGPTFLQLGPSGDLFASVKGGTSSDKVIKIALPSGTATDFLSFGASVNADPQGIVFSQAGEMYVAAQLPGTVCKVIYGTSTPLPIAATSLPTALEGLDSPAGIALGTDDRLYVATKDNIIVSRRDSKVWTTFVSGLSGGMYNNIEYAGNGEFYIADYAAGRILRVTLPTTQAAPPSGFPIAYKINDVGHPKITDGSAFTAIRNAFQHWQDITTCKASFQDGGLTTARYASMGDGLNLVTFTDDQFPFSPRVLAVVAKTLHVDPGQNTATIVDADIVFNPAFAARINDGFSTDTYPSITNDTTYDIESVATHEIGHILGLVHSGVPNGTMFFQLQSRKEGRTLEPDDVGWASYRYPEPGYATSFGSIEGTVRYGYDQNKTVAGALVLARDTITSVYHHAYTDENGHYLIPGLPSDPYVVSIRPLDGKVFGTIPMTAANVSAYLYAITSILDYPGERYNQNDAAIEPVDLFTPVNVTVGQSTTGIDFVTNIDPTGLAVKGVYPVNNATNVDPLTQIVVTFTKPVNPGSLSSSTLKVSGTSGSALPGTYRLINNDTTVLFVPAQPLTALTTYTIRATTGITDVHAQGLAAEFTSTFQTAAPDLTPPTVEQIVPVRDSTGIYVTSPVVIRFSKPMNPATFTSVTFSVTDSLGGSAVAGTLTFTQQNTITTFTPASMLAEGTTYKVLITTGVTDAVGNALTSDFKSAFQTVSNAPPSVVAIGPANGAIDISVATSILVDFSKSINTSTVTNQTISLTLGGSPVAGTFEFLIQNSRVLFRPSSTLAFGMTYQITITTGIRDLSGHSLTAGATSAFTTAAQPQKPVIYSIDPPAAPTGAIVVIAGNGFDPDPTKNTISFNGIIVQASSSSLTDATAVVPDGALSGPVTVSVQTHVSDSFLFDVLIPLAIPQDNIIAEAPTQSEPKGADITPDGAYAYVTNYASNSVSVIDLRSATPTVSVPIPVGKNPYNIIITPNGKLAYVTNYGSNAVSVIDIGLTSANRNRVIKTISVGMNPMGIAVTRDNIVYVANSGSKKLSVIDGDPTSGTYNQIIAEAPTNSPPRDVAVSPDGGLAFVTGGGALVIIDISRSSDSYNKIIGEVATNSETKEVAVTPDGTLAIVTTKDGGILLIDAFRKSSSFGQIIAGASTTSSADEPVPSPDGTHVYVTNTKNNTVSVYDFTYAGSAPAGIVNGVVSTSISLKLLHTIQVGTAPQGIVIDPLYQKIVVVNSGSSNVTIIRVSGVTEAALQTLGTLNGTIQSLMDKPTTSKQSASHLKIALDALKVAADLISKEDVSHACDRFREAIHELQLASSSSVAVSGSITSIVQVADRLAQDAVNAAKAIPPSSQVNQKIASAVSELASARAYVAKGGPENAMTRYKTAWDQAQLAIKLAQQAKGSNGGKPQGTDVEPTELTLGQNYPNPFNSTTQIVFDIPVSETGGLLVELKVYNILGQLVRTLVNEVKAPGRYVVRWSGNRDDGSSTASGMYLVRFKAGTFQQTRRIMLIQ